MSVIRKLTYLAFGSNLFAVLNVNKANYKAQLVVTFHLADPTGKVIYTCISIHLVKKHIYIQKLVLEVSGAL